MFSNYSISPVSLQVHVTSRFSLLRDTEGGRLHSPLPIPKFNSALNFE